MMIKADLVKHEITTHVTKPPKQHTERTLLRVMETCGKNYDGEGTDEESLNAILSGFSIGFYTSNRELKR